MPEITPVPPRSIAGIASFRDHDAMLTALQAELGAAIPTKPGFLRTETVTIARLAPTRLLATAAPDANLPVRLGKTLDGLAAVTNQSDMWAAWQIAGAGAGNCLARVVPIDLAPEIFQIGDLALTRTGHLDVRFCRIDNEVYEIAVTRSTAADLLHSLEACLRG